MFKKRHHARFFPIEQRDADRSENCLPGTIIDTDVVHPFEFDFYLQAHAAIKGTASPAHYYVLYDDNNFNADSLQGLTYKLCYIYARSSCSVSVVPSVYYAHLVATRARCHRRGGDWSDFRLTELNNTEAQIAEYAVVKPEFTEHNVLYIIRLEASLYIYNFLKQQFNKLTKQLSILLNTIQSNLDIRSLYITETSI